MYLTAPFVLRSQLFRFTRKHGIFSLKVISELPTRRHKIQTSNDHLGSQWSTGILRVKRQHRRLLRKMQISVNLRPNSQIGYIFSVTWIVHDLSPVAIHKIAFFPRGNQIRNPINRWFIGFLTDLLYSVRSSTRTCNALVLYWGPAFYKENQVFVPDLPLFKMRLISMNCSQLKSLRLC